MGAGKVFPEPDSGVLRRGHAKTEKKIFFPFAKKEVETDLSVTDVSLLPSRARDKFSSFALLMQMASNTPYPPLSIGVWLVFGRVSLSQLTLLLSPSCLFLLLLSESHKGRGGSRL